MVRPIDFKDNKVFIVNQLLLPEKFEEIEIDNYRGMVKAIKEMVIRGAPALGIAGAFGCYLAAKESQDKEFLKDAFYELKKARPTAVNLQWAVEKCEKLLNKNYADLEKELLKEAIEIQIDDIRRCKNIGRNGIKFIKNGFGILTHCNAGSLATGDYGTALAPIYKAKENGLNIFVYVDETRPYLQGARLTAWELSKAGIKNTVICDSMAGFLMAQGKIDIIIVGADRIAKNGDVANKIGSYSLSVLAKYHNIPFYVAAPLSTYDNSISEGKDIPIEERSEDELRYFNGKKIVPDQSNVYNPAFDIIPAENITAYITEIE
jgi:methylthioribose-1-phosphate isomerase